MKIVAFLSLFLFTLAGWSQNLVPNPGFEEHDETTVLTWVQPPEPFYHFESSEQGEPKSGEYYNGLCVYNHSVSEYLSVKLKDPLSAGQEYCMSLYIRLADFKAIRFTKSEGIGCFFSPEMPDITHKTYLFDQPQVILKYGVMDDRFGWTKLECKFTAEGGERYLTIGQFFDAEELERDDPVTAAFKKEMLALDKDRDDKLIEAYASIDQRYPQIKIDYSDPLREYSKKEMKAFEKEKQNVRLRMVEKQEATEAITAEHQKLSEELNDRYKDTPIPYFSLRYYFDDVNLTALFDGDFCACDGPIEIAAGETFQLKDILFETGKFDVLDDSFAELDRLAKFLQEHPGITVKVNGHTDNVGENRDNMQLSMDRAKAVAIYLNKQGVAAKRLKFEGFGDTLPVASNATETGRQRNRRVEVEIVSVE